MSIILTGKGYIKIGDATFSNVTLSNFVIDMVQRERPGAIDEWERTKESLRNIAVNFNVSPMHVGATGPIIDTTARVVDSDVKALPGPGDPKENRATS